ncbi:MAG: hypothetical protein Q8P12_02465, partial [bacterium]|nr:hypothetical protein [bacterium]
IECQAQKHPEPVKVALQKIADWFETFALALSQETKKKTKKPTGSPQRDDLVAKAQAERIKEFARRLAEAQTSEVDPLIERVKKEARALAEAEKLMNEGPPEPPEPPKPPKEKPWMKKAGQGLQAVNDAKVLEPVQSGIERLNDWLRRKI